jgi:hypothetical protein
VFKNKKKANLGLDVVLVLSHCSALQNGFGVLNRSVQGMVRHGRQGMTRVQVSS